MHVHTRFSADSLMCLRCLYLMCIIRKINYIAITEHNNITGALRFSEYCESHGNKVHVIIGEEVMTDSGEIIGLFLKQKIESGKSVEDTISEIKKQNGIVYIPHPYDEKRAKTVLDENEIKKHQNEIDCIECHNGRNVSPTFSVKQDEIAEKYQRQKVVGSDAHTFFEIGRNYMDIKEPPLDADSFRRTIPKAILHKKVCLKTSHLVTKFVKAIRYIMEGNWNELCRAFFRRIKK